MKRKFFYFDDPVIKESIAEQFDAEMISGKDFRKNPYKYSNSTIFMRGISHYKYIKIIKDMGSDLYYIDTGYFGNFNNYYVKDQDAVALKGKQFHRVVYNDMQTIHFNEDGKRYNKILKIIKSIYNISSDNFILPWKKDGDKILICPPSGKSASIFDMDPDSWLENVIKEVSSRTDKKIIIREKPQSRKYRMYTDPIQYTFDKGIYLLITENSIAATEAILHGIPALTLGTTNAAAPMAIRSFNDINKRIFPDRTKWINALCNELYYHEELSDGTLYKNIMHKNKFSLSKEQKKIQKKEDIFQENFKDKSDVITCLVDEDKKISKIMSTNILKNYNNTNVIKFNNENIYKNGLIFLTGLNSVVHNFQKILDNEIKYLYLDNSYFNGSGRYRLILNHIHPQKDGIKNIKSDIKLLPWRTKNRSEYILVCPPSGPLLKMFNLHKDWLFNTVNTLRNNTDQKILIKFKNHDLYDAGIEEITRIKDIKNVIVDKSTIDENIHDLINLSHAVVAPASGVSVMAAIRGIPVFAEKISPVADIAELDYSKINNPIFPNRDKWFGKIISHDFSLLELQNGLWLKRMKLIYPDELKEFLDENINLL